MLLGWGSDAFSEAKEREAKEELAKVLEPELLEELLVEKSAVVLLEELLSDIKDRL